MGLPEPAAGVQRLVQDALELRCGPRHPRLRLTEALGVGQGLDRAVDLLVGEGLLGHQRRENSGSARPSSAPVAAPTKPATKLASVTARGSSASSAANT